MHGEYFIVIFTLVTAQTVVLLLMTFIFKYAPCLRENDLFPFYYYNSRVTCFSSCSFCSL